MNALVRVNTVERVERMYMVQVPINDNDTPDDLFAKADALVQLGETNSYKMTEGNCDIEEVLSVEVVE